MKLGDIVSWWDHTGTIVAIIPAYESPYFADAIQNTRLRIMFTESTRNHKSYLVQVGNKLYRPRVKDLVVEADEDEESE